MQYTCMKNTTAAVDSATPPDATKQPACHLVTGLPSASTSHERQAPLAPRTIGRPDTLTAQRVEVGIVLNAMLGISAATEYLDKHAVDVDVMLRVLSPTGRRRGTHDANGVRT